MKKLERFVDSSVKVLSLVAIGWFMVKMCILGQTLILNEVYIGLFAVIVLCKMGIEEHITLLINNKNTSEEKEK